MNKTHFLFFIYLLFPARGKQYMVNFVSELGLHEKSCDLWYCNGNIHYSTPIFFSLFTSSSYPYQLDIRPVRVCWKLSRQPCFIKFFKGAVLYKTAALWSIAILHYLNSNFDTYTELFEDVDNHLRKVFCLYCHNMINASWLCHS